MDSGMSSTVLQVGMPRTATTLQFQTLCAVMFQRYADSNQSVHCYFKGTGVVPCPVPGSYLVIKTHVPPKIPACDNPVEPWIFTSTRSANRTTRWAQLPPSERIPHISIPSAVKMTQTTGMLEEYGYKFFAAQYSRMFQLTTVQEVQLHDYLRYWDVLRQCCGTQMSKDWRAILVAGDPMAVGHHSVNRSAYPACEMYDLDAVEAKLMQTEIFRKFSRRSKVLASVSTNDDPLNGTYCTATNEWIATNKAHFNEHPQS